jgi:ABC-type Fe3+-hydroxamate transport system substrate-binding protein
MDEVEEQTKNSVSRNPQLVSLGEMLVVMPAVGRGRAYCTVANIYQAEGLRCYLVIRTIANWIRQNFEDAF